MKAIASILLILSLLASPKHSLKYSISDHNQTSGVKSLLSKNDPSYFYVTARNGLNYRDTPSGKILGKLALNTFVTVVEGSGIMQTITDAGKQVTGEWVAVEAQGVVNADVELDRVFVFDAFLATEPVQPNLSMYYTHPNYNSGDGDIRTGFVNLSDRIFGSIYRDGNPFELTGNYSSDTLRLNKRDRHRMMKEMRLSENDSVFIYDLKSTQVTKFSLANLPAIACPNIYAQSRRRSTYSLEDLEYGFDVGEYYQGEFNFTYVGRNNIFSSAGLTAIKWSKPQLNEVETLVDRSKFTQPEIDRFLGSDDIKHYIYRTNDYILLTGQRISQSYNNELQLAVFERISKKVITKRFWRSGESTNVHILNDDGSNTEYSYGSQYIGKLFNSKEPVLFNFASYSFGCPEIIILDPTEPDVHISCDNRH
jgi:hypothetical protein